MILLSILSHDFTSSTPKPTKHTTVAVPIRARHVRYAPHSKQQHPSTTCLLSVHHHYHHPCKMLQTKTDTDRWMHGPEACLSRSHLSIHTHKEHAAPQPLSFHSHVALIVLYDIRTVLVVGLYCYTRLSCPEKSTARNNVCLSTYYY